MAQPASRDQPTVAFERLYAAHHREVLAYFMRRLPRDEAEDAAADVFAVAWRRLQDVPEGERAVAWLFGVAQRVLSNYHRTRRRGMRLRLKLGALSSPSPRSPESQVIRSAEDHLLIKALDGLRWPDKEVLRLATWEKLPYALIGETLGISEAAVGQRVARARKRLDKELDRLETGGRLRASLTAKKGARG